MQPYHLMELNHDSPLSLVWMTEVLPKKQHQLCLVAWELAATTTKRANPENLSESSVCCYSFQCIC